MKFKGKDYLHKAIVVTETRALKTLTKFVNLYSLLLPPKNYSS